MRRPAGGAVRDLSPCSASEPRTAEMDSGMHAIVATVIAALHNDPLWLMIDLLQKIYMICRKWPVELPFLWLRTHSFCWH